MTEKSMKKHLRRIYFHLEKLQNALTDAHNKELLMYKDFTEESPCYSLFKCEERIHITTKDQIAKIIRREVRKGI